ncbi:MAG: pyrroline-5-carboxylate reductase [Alphaproteobacteria bacterium]|nr:pyrroline-5-carboxylate reductase [Alphaproteobacteria bacterium]MBV9371115.1 pyrroline-5-carboxylate reductase [Alphaproteobacteria bacterium]MBV9901511.1 pyrroline-5-carboxylate reductase [Alphaproteobacteria bacterium]
MKDPLSLPGPLLMIGAGNMAGAMLQRWLAAGMDPAQVTVVRPSGRPAGAGVRVLTALPEDEVPALVLLGVKPQKLAEVAPGLARLLDPATILVSILAGVERATLRRLFPAPRAIVRAMPNTPVALGKGVVPLIGEGAGQEAAATVERLMRALGRVEWFEDEALFALAGHLTAAAPAFLYRFVEGLALAATELGLPAAQAERLALSMAEGAAALAAGADETPRELARRVASPGGTTEAGLRVLDGEAGLAPLLRAALDASRRRSIEMAEAARIGP